MTNKRIAWIDWAKGWTIFSVVIYHAFRGLYDNQGVFSGVQNTLNKDIGFVVGTIFTAFIMPVFLHYLDMFTERLKI